MPDLHASPGAPLVWDGVTAAGERYHGAGTLGAFLEDDAGAFWILSANHAVGQNGRCRENRLSVPGVGVVAEEVVCVPIHDFPAVNRVDVAIARWTGPAAGFGCAIPGMAPLVACPVAPEESPGLRVTKAALPPRRSSGVVADVRRQVRVDLSPSLPYTFAQFADQILVADEGGPFSRPGDSGSLVVCAGVVCAGVVCAGVVCAGTECTRAVGLLIASHADGVWSAVTPLANVLEDLESAVGRRFRLAV
jgi:hypothetical protein